MALPAWARRYIGLEFRDGGRSIDGVDCWGLVCLVYQEQFGVELPRYEGAYACLRDLSGCAAVAEAERGATGRWRALEGVSPVLGDVVTFRPSSSSPAHCGVVVDPGTMLHAWAGSNSCMEAFNGRLWGPRLDGVYRFVGPLSVVTQARPLASPAVQEVPAGMTLSEILASVGVDPNPELVVCVGDVRMPAECWAHVRPRPGRRVTVSVPLRGGGGGKDTWRIVAMIAVVVVAFAAPYALAAAGVGGLFTTAGALTFTGALISAGIGIGGSLLVNSLIPPPTQGLASTPASEQRFGLDGASNEIRRFGVPPAVFGFHRIVPPFAAVPVTETVGDDQYLRVLFNCGRGPLELSDFRIGNTPLEDYDGVQIEVRPGYADDAPISLYSDTVRQEQLQILIASATGNVVRTSAPGVDELSVDLTLPRGLGRVEGDSIGQQTVELTIEWAAQGTLAWKPAGLTDPTDSNTLAGLFNSGTEVYQARPITTSAVDVDQAVEWGLGFGSSPAPIPAANYSVELTGFLFVYLAEAGAYTFAVDGSDAVEVMLNGQIVASWYGLHSTSGGADPNYAAHAGSPVTLAAGYHTLRVRYAARSTAGAVAVGWKKPGASVYETIPLEHLARRAWSGAEEQGLSMRVYDIEQASPSFQLTANSTDPIRRSISWAVPHGQYDIRIRRETADATSANVLDVVYWTAIRGVEHRAPVRMPRVAQIALRIRATDQLNGVIDSFSCMARSIFPDYDATLGGWIERPTNNPASLYRGLLQHVANRRRLSDSRIDLEALQSWHAGCVAGGRAFNAVFDDRGTVYERMVAIASAGRAAPAVTDGLHSVVQDVVRTVPVQHFTPRNSSGFKGRRVYPRIPHALRVMFVNEDKDFVRDERLVLNDGYQVDGLDAFGEPAPALPAATEFDVLELYGITNPAQVFKAGRYWLAVTLLRPEVYELTSDIEHIVCNRGDLVLLTHDVPLFGLQSARIVELLLNDGGSLIGLRLDEAVTMDAGDSYAVRVRLNQEAPDWQRNLLTAEGSSSSVYFVGPVAVGELWPEVDNLVQFGRHEQVTHEVVVRSIEPDADHNARMTFVDHAPGVHDADTGPIPDYDADISLPPSWSNRPATPVLESIVSDENVMVRVGATLIPRIVITLAPVQGTRPIGRYVQVRIRRTGSGVAYQSRPQVELNAGRVVIDDVEDGVEYEIRLRTVSELGAASDWLDITHRVVGKSSLPPNVDTLEVTRLSDGTRRYVWTIADIPPDFAGVRLKYGAPGTPWSSMAPLSTALFAGSPIELSEPPAGTWQISARAVDTSGNESAASRSVTVTLGEPPAAGVLLSASAGADGWAGTKTRCRVNSQNYLEYNESSLTWGDLSTWDSAGWRYWGEGTPDNGMEYVYQVDAGAVIEFVPDIEMTVQGSVPANAFRVRSSADGVLWSEWVTVSRASTLVDAALRRRVARTTSSPALIGRYLQVWIRATGDFVIVAGPGASLNVPMVEALIVRLRGDPASIELNDLDTAAITGAARIAVGDVRVPVANGSLSAIRSVFVSFNNTGGGFSYEVLDKAVDPGPRIRIYDDTGALADAVIDVAVRGVKGV